MSLVADYDSDSNSSSNSSSSIKAERKDSSESEEDLKSAKIGTVSKPVLKKLPVPKFSNKIIQNEDNNTGSVFVNPYLEAEHAKEAILQKHVKMIDNKGAVLINGKKICWNYRKGRCRFGHNCKFAHDSDLQKTEQQLEEELNISKAESVVCQSTNFDTTKLIVAEQKKRKRPGLSQGLIPGKKVMKQYLNNKK